MLRACLRSAARGARHGVVVEGEAGIGKTRLIGVAVADAAAQGFEVVAGAGDELFDDRPGGVLVDAFGLTAEEHDPERAFAAEAVGLTEPVRADPVASRSRVIEAFGALTERLAARTPVLLVLEDLQWADPLSLLGLRALWRRLAHLPVALLATFRPSPLRPELAACLTEMERDGAERLTVGPLEAGAMAEIARAQLGAVPGPGLRDVLDRAGGNPLFALEVLRGFEAEDLLVRQEGTVDVTSPAVPSSLMATVLSRLSGLDEAALQALRMGAVLGARFTARQLSAQLGLTPVELLQVVDQLVRVGLLTQDDDYLAFRHDVVREAVYLDLPASLRAALHAEIARRLAADGAWATEVARHYVRGAEPGDNDAVEWLRRGAREQLPHDPVAAAELLERARELAGPDHPRSAALAAAHVLALAWAARLDEAERVGLRASSGLPDARGRAQLYVGLARARLLHGRLGEASAAFAAALTPSEPQARSELLAERAAAELFRGGLAAARRDADAALADEARSVAASATATVVAAFEATLRGCLDDGARRARAALDLAATAHAPWASRVASMAPFCLTRAARLSEALDTAGHALAAAEEGGRANEAASLQSVLGVLEFHAGRWDEADAHLATALTLADDVGVPVIVGAWWPPAVRAHIAARRGDLALAEAVLAGVPAEPADDGPRLGFDYVCWTRALMAHARGRPALALDWLRAAWQLDGRLGLRSEPGTYASELVRLALDEGDRACAHEVTEEVEHTAARAPQPTTEGVALHCRGLLAGDPERLVAAVERLHATLELLPRALASEDAARHAADADPPGAIELALEAVTAFEGLGATRDAARVRALLRRLGVRRGERGRRQRPTTGWDSLTPTELEVIRLVVEGLTNREIGARLYISPRTVGTHISHALGKLGLRSRVELAAEMARRA